MDQSLKPTDPADPDAHPDPSMVTWTGIDERNELFWLFQKENASATMMERNGITQINVDSVARNGKLVCGGGPSHRYVDRGAAYTLQFRACADLTRDVEINIQINSDSFRTVVEPRPHARLTTVWHI